MRKLIGYIPAALFTGFYLFSGLTGASITMSMVIIWLACFWLSAFFLHKGLFWGGAFGLLPGVHMIYMSTQYTGQVINIEMPLGIILILFYGIYGFYLWKKRNDIPKPENKEIVIMVVKIALTIAVLMVTAYSGIVGAMILTVEGIHPVITGIGAFVIPTLFLPLIWLKKRKKFFLIWLIPAVIYFIGGDSESHKGESYTIIIPSKDYRYEKDYDDGALEEKWEYTKKDDVEIKVTTYKNSDEISARTKFLKDYDEYIFEDLLGQSLCGQELDGDTLWFNIHISGETIYIVSWEFPKNTSKELQNELSSIAGTFTLAE